MGRKTRYRILVTPELFSQVSDENKELMKGFLEYLSSIGRSKTTINNYENDIKIFYIWNLNNNNNKFFVDLVKRDVLKYQNYLVNELEESSSRVRGLKSALSSMSNFIERMFDDIYPNFRPLINKIPSPPSQPTREKTILENNQIEKLLSILIENKQYQKACLLALACASGARKSELLRFKASYFTDKNIVKNFFYKTPEKIKTKGRGNGNFLNKYIIIDKFKHYLELWLKQREELGVDIDNLFVCKKEDKWVILEKSALDSYAKTFSKILGIDFYLHSCRHFYTTYLSEYGLPSEVIKILGGWASVGMVSLYVDTPIDDELGKYFDGKESD